VEEPVNIRWPKRCTLNKKKWYLPDWLVTMPVAHRGLHDNTRGIPENSIPAFEKAVEKGFPIEMDVHLLRDGKPAVFHDDSLLRVTGVDRPISEITSTEALQLRLLNTSHHLPLLQNVLECVDGSVPLLIEVKNRGSGEAVGDLEASLLDTLSHYKGEYVIESFNPIVLKWFRLRAPHILRGQLAGDSSKETLPYYQKFLQKRLLHNWISDPHFIAYDIRCLPYWPVSFSSRSKILLGYTAKSPEDHRRALQYCDNVIFEGYDPSAILREESDPVADQAPMAACL